MRKVSEEPLFALEVFFNSTRNTKTQNNNCVAVRSQLEVFFKSRGNMQTQNRICDVVRSAVVIAIDNYLLDSLCRFTGDLNVMRPHTRQISEHIMGHVDKNLISCLEFASLPWQQQQNLVSFAPMSLKGEFSSSVVGILATMSVVFRSTTSCGYHHSTLKLFWNSSVKLLELHGANRQDVFDCLRLHIMDRIAYAKGSSRGKLHWNRNQDTGNILIMHRRRKADTKG
uniref:Uncharacterized protein n=1 Tax=Spongospora subterranea TaxID=70186 RepID=A0A0H5R8M1_9EUKA|eukprot:CRZ04709.1 hypothetical protein [Spongospora subterranea]